MPRVLIITYYWPPSGGSSVLRWLKFTKYLRGFGWEPVIYTPSNPEPQEIDYSLLKDIPENLEVIRSRIWEPYSVYKWLTGKKQSDRLGVALMSDKKKPGIAGKISLWIRSNLFIPDPRRCWVRPSVKLLSGYLKENPADVIITTGPPHSMHLIGLGLKRKLVIRWVADFRDPWTDIDFYRELLLTTFADRVHKTLERKVLLAADRVVTVSPGMTLAFKERGINHVETIPNGYDEEPLSDQQPDVAQFTLLHLGSLPITRNPENLWQVLSELVETNTEFSSRLKVRLIGKADLKVSESIRKFKLQQYVTLEEYVPHEQTLSLLGKASLLLLCINNSPNARGILTNKIFEYLSARRPILALGPLDGDAASILAETKAGRIFPYTETAGLKEHILTLFDLYSHQKLYVESENYSRFSRKNLTRELSELLNNLTA